MTYAWLLILFVYGTGGPVTVPAIATQKECESLAYSLKSVSPTHYCKRYLTRWPHE